MKQKCLHSIKMGKLDPVAGEKSPARKRFNYQKNLKKQMQVVTNR